MSAAHQPGFSGWSILFPERSGPFLSRDKQVVEPWRRAILIPRSQPELTGHPPSHPVQTMVRTMFRVRGVERIQALGNDACPFRCQTMKSSKERSRLCETPEQAEVIPQHENGVEDAQPAIHAVNGTRVTYSRRISTSHVEASADRFGSATVCTRSTAPRAARWRRSARFGSSPRAIFTTSATRAILVAPRCPSSSQARYGGHGYVRSPAGRPHRHRTGIEIPCGAWGSSPKTREM